MMRTVTKCFKYVLRNKQFIFNRKLCFSPTKPPWKILFFGTDNFSVSSLKYLNDEYKRGELVNTLEVVTSSKAKDNPVSSFSKQEHLLTHRWPIDLYDNKFDLGIVVSFGHLIPVHIIQKFHLGMINVHASLLPRWRGAAPIIHTIANEDEKTGVTIMKIQPKKFDVGEIIAQHEIDVPKNVLMPDLYKHLANLGAKLLIATLKEIPQCLNKATQQPNYGITYAPKVTSGMAKINWNQMSARQIYALARALHGLYPLVTSWNNTPIKLFDINLITEKSNSNCLPGTVEYHKNRNQIAIKCSDELWISCSKIGILGKKPMSALDFNNGYLKKEPVEKRIFK